MKYGLAVNAEVKHTPTAHRVTWEDAYEMLETNITYNRIAAKRLTKDLEACEVINNLTVAQIMKSNGSLEQLGEEALTDMSKAFDVSVESIKDMSLESFIEMTNRNMPGRGAEPATEDAAIVFAVSYFATMIVIFGVALIAAQKMTKYEFWWNERLEPDIESILREKGEKALSEVMLPIFDAKEFTQQIKACNDILVFLDQDVKKLYGDSTKIVDIEKQALKLWACPQALVMTSDHMIVEAGWGKFYTVLNEWFDTWNNNQPEAKNKTLGEHGFTYKTLVSTCHELKDLCVELVKIGQLHATIQNGHLRAKKEISPGFWKSLKLFFTEKREDREKRKQAELIINAKYAALRNLCRGFDWSVREMCGQFFSIAVKTEKYVKTEAKKAASEKAAAKK